jgi:hypothetical protein
VLVNGFCNIVFGSMDALAFARGALLILFGSIFNFVFGWMGVLAFGCGAVIFFLGATTETLETVARAHWAFAFGGTLVVFFFVSFFFADFVVFVSFNLKLDGNFIIPSSFNNFKFGSVKFGFPLPCSIIFLDAAFAWVIQRRSCLCGSLFGTDIFPCYFLYLKMFDVCLHREVELQVGKQVDSIILQYSILEFFSLIMHPIAQHAAFHSSKIAGEMAIAIGIIV